MTARGQHRVGLPQGLFPIAYESHGFLLVELGLLPEKSAPIWYYAFGNEAYVLTYPSLAGLFRACAMAAEVAGVRPPEEDTDRWSTYSDLLDGPGFTSIVERQLEASPHAGRDRRVPVEDVRRWPGAWQRAQGVTEDSLKRLGATHSVREFAEEAASGPVSDRVVGRFRVHGGGGIGADGTLASYGALTDETGSILVLKPGSVLDVGGRARDAEVEVDLMATGPVVERDDLDSRAIQNAALAGDLDTASALAEEFVASMQDLAMRLPVVRRIVPLQ